MLEKKEIANQWEKYIMHMNLNVTCLWKIYTRIQGTWILTVSCIEKF